MMGKFYDKVTNVRKRFIALTHDEKKEKLEFLSKVRGEPIEVTFRKFGNNIKKIPRSFSKHTVNVINADFVDAGVRDGMPYVKISDSRIFYGHFSNPNSRRAYEFLKDIVSPVLTSDTYLTALDVTHRYLTDFFWFPKELLPGTGGVIVEVGAYLGHKTIRLIDDIVGTTGKVLAIEMMPDNVSVLRRNVEANGLEDCIDIVECGVWNKKGETVAMGKGRQRNSLISLEKLKPDFQIKVPTDSLDNILPSWCKDTIDLLILTVNGVEIEALQGLDKELNRVKIIFVAAPYSRDGKRNYDVCLEILKDKGCFILPQTTQSRIYAVTEKHAKDYT